MDVYPRNIVAPSRTSSSALRTRRVLGPKERLGMRRLDRPRNLDPPRPFIPLAFIGGAAGLDAFAAPETS